MIRRLLRKAAGRALGRDRTPRHEPSRPTTPARRVEPEPLPPEPEPELDIEIEGPQLGEWLADGKEVVLLDIREPHELQHGVAKGALVIRMNDIPSRMEELPNQDTRLVVYCAAGGRSFSVTAWLREQGWNDSWSLAGGYHDYLRVGEADSWPPKAGALGCELADVAALKDVLSGSGRPMLVNHWASWCDGCVEELPLLVRLHKEWGETIDFVGISWEGFQGSQTGAPLVAKVERFSQEQGLSWRSLVVDVEPEVLFEGLNLTCQTIPQIWLVDAKGSVVHRIEVVLDEAGLTELTEQIAALG